MDPSKVAMIVPAAGSGKRFGAAENKLFSMLNGKPVWQHTFDSPLDDRFFEGGPTATPTIDGDHLYVLGRQGDLFCFERATGNVVWQINLIDETNVRAPGWGFSSSPARNMLFFTRSKKNHFSST